MRTRVAGEAEGVSSSRSSSARGFSARAILLGLLLIPLNIWWVTVVEVQWYDLDGSCLPLFITPVFMFFCLFLANLAVRRLRPRWALSRQEILAVYIMLVISETIAGHDMLQNMFGAITHPFYYADSSNRWETIFFRYLPRWLYITDEESLSGFYCGGESMYQWRLLAPWAVPLAIWSVFTLTLVGMMVCLNVLIRQQWTEKEKLTYPIVQLPLRLTEGEGDNETLRSRLLWIGFGAAFLVGLINGLNFLYPGSVPMIPGVKLYRLDAYVPGWAWTAMGSLRISMYPFMIGIAFFLPNDLAFSCWFFFLFSKIEQMGGALTGWRDVPGFPFFKAQASGAWLGLAGTALWVTRRHLIEVFRRVFGLGDVRGEEDQPLSYRWAVVGLVGGMAILTVISWLAGMTLWAIAVFFGLYFLISIAITRVRAEFGAPHEIYNVNPLDIMAAAVGNNFLPPRTEAVMCTYYWFNRGYRNLPMPNQLEAFKMAQVTEMDQRRLVWVIMLASAVSIIFTCWANFSIAFEEGSFLIPGFKRWAGWESFNRLTDWLTKPAAPDMRSIVIMAAAFVFMFLLKEGRTRFFNWPFHPAGYALAVSFAMDYFWFCFFIAWVVKTVLGHVRGIPARKAAAPFFLGLILGDFTIGSIWAIIGPLRQIQTYKIFI